MCEAEYDLRAPHPVKINGTIWWDRTERANGAFTPNAFKAYWASSLYVKSMEKRADVHQGLVSHVRSRFVP